MDLSRAFRIGSAIILLGAAIAVLALALLWDGVEGSRDLDVAGSAGAERELGARGDADTTSRAAASSAPTPILPRQVISRTGIAGRVVDEDGAAIAGVTVTVEESPPPAAWLRGPDPRGPIMQARTDGAGRFEATDLDPGSCEVVAEMPGYGWHALRSIRVEPGRMVEVEIALAPSPERLGRVVDPAGEPVDAAEVVIESGPFGAFGGQSFGPSLSRTTVAGGWFSFPDASDSRLGSIRIRARKAGVGVGTCSITTHGRVSGVTTVSLLPTRRLTCRFSPEDGSSPPSSLPFAARSSSGFFFAGTTDSSGVGIVPEFPTQDEVSITVNDGGWKVPPDSAQHRGAHRKRFEVPATGDVEITVPLGRTPPPPGGAARASDGFGIVEGVVLDASGGPVAGLTVNAQHRVAPGLEATTDEHGRFRLARVAMAGNCRVGARRGRGPFTWSQPFDLAPEATVTGVTIVMGKDPELVVEVVGADGRRPEGIVIVAEDPEDGRPDRARVACRTDQNGRAAFDSVPAERVRVTVDPASLPPGVQVEDEFKNLVPTGANARVVMRLRAEVIIRGSVVLEDGSPVGQGTIWFAPDDGVHSKFVRTNARGQFTLRVRSLHGYRFKQLTRVVRRPGSDHPELEIYEPADDGVMQADGAPIIVRLEQ